MILIVIVILILLMVILVNRENFGVNKSVIVCDNAEFRGMNIISTNEDDFIPSKNEKDCREWCLFTEGCKGYSFYSPGQRCMLFGSGGIVQDRPGYTSGRVV